MVPPMRKDGDVLAMGIEGSANKLGVGIIRYRADGETEILSNPRKTYITPPGQGFLPRETAWHHQNHVVGIVRAALAEANVSPQQLDCICYTRARAWAGRCARPPSARGCCRCCGTSRWWASTTASDVSALAAMMEVLQVVVLLTCGACRLVQILRWAAR